MTLMLSKTYDALRCADGVSEDQARAAAEELAAYELRLIAIEARLTMLEAPIPAIKRPNMSQRATTTEPIDHEMATEILKDPEFREQMKELKRRMTDRNAHISEMQQKLEQALAETWVTRMANHQPFRRLIRHRPGRFLLYWLTLLAGMAILLGFAFMLVPLATLLTSFTGSPIVGISTMFLAASFVVAIWGYWPWSLSVTRRLMVWLRILEKHS
jgi:hypothetical protein